MKTFRGFNPSQMRSIANQYGYSGDMANFNDYLNTNPDKASRFNRLQEKAKGYIQNGGAPTSGQSPNGMAPPPTPLMAPPDNQLFVQGGRVVESNPAPVGDPNAMPMPSGQMSQPQPMPTKNSGVVVPPTPTGIDTRMYPTPPANETIGNKISPNLPAGYAKGGDVKKPGWEDEEKDKKNKKHRANPLKDQRERIEDWQNRGSGKDKIDHWTDKTDATISTKKAIENPEKLITPVDVTKMEVKDKQLIDKDSGQVKNIAQPDTSTVDKAAQGTVSTAQTPEEKDANLAETDKAADKVKDAANDTQAAQGTLSEESKVQAATALPSSDATVQGQLTKLMKDFEGGETPAWAAGAMRMANAAMAARGLGSSSMAGAAVTQAAMESAIGIATQDAQTFSQFEMQNLNNRQQARLVNAQAFLQMDLANLNNRQQTELFRSQAIIQSLFTDQAAENATRQFNATSQNQTDQFFSNLKAQVQTFNAAQKNAMEQFNAGEKNETKQFNAAQKNAMKQFRATIKTEVQKFNAQNRLIIDQSNAEWRRQIATTNNANQNEANRINAQAATGLTMAAFNNLWQQERDLMAYAFTAGENSQQRAHEIVLAKLGAELDMDLQESANRGALWEAAGSFVGNLFDGLF